MCAKLSQVGEFGLIEIIRRITKKTKGVVRGIGDDTAVLASGAKYLLFTTDMLAEGVHFKRQAGGHAIGHKALACSISDIAAMGGLPTYAVVSLGVPASLDISFVKDLYAGMNALARRFKVAIVGGDTIKTDKIVINVALLGEVSKKHLVTRAGARPGDWIFVSGPLGGSLRSGKHLGFIPRIKESQWLVTHCKPSAMIDISDGLAADLGHILEESRVGALLEAPRIPLNKAVGLNQALYEGEDFELLWIVRPEAGKKLLKARNKGGHFYHIGKIVARNKGLKLSDGKGHSRELPVKGFTHF